MNLQRALRGSALLEEDQVRAERFNRDMAKREAGNFYWGFISLGYHERMAIYALYNFARQVDDEADAVGVENLPARLAVHRERISRAVRDEYGEDPILRVLSEAIHRYQIPERELQMLVDGVEMDFTKTRYATFAELQAYCTLVASVVGRMCVRIFGFSDPVALQHADDLGMALQLTNILRDVREDAVDLCRVYLPQDELERFGIPESALADGRILSAMERPDRPPRRARARVFLQRLRSAALYPPPPGGVRANDGGHLRGAAQEDRARARVTAARACGAFENRKTLSGRAFVALQRVAVAGGGLAGLSAALALKKRGARVDLFERGQLVGGRAT